MHFFLDDMRLFHKGFLKFHVRWRVPLKGTVHPNMKIQSLLPPLVLKDVICTLAVRSSLALTSDEVRANCFSSAATVNISAYKRMSGKLSWHIPRYLHKGIYLKSSSVFFRLTPEPRAQIKNNAGLLFQEFGEYANWLSYKELNENAIFTQEI